jgi:glyceraldehyde 3-phosphate dehydrogenase
MGFGRIGRNLFRLLYKRSDLRLRAISDTADPSGLEYLLRFDTIMGRFPDAVSIRDGNLYAWGRQIPLLAGADPGSVPWGELGVEIVVEATGKSRSRADLERHLAAGAKWVILCTPPLEPPDLTVVMGINDQQLEPQHRILSNASCTAQSIAPVLAILDEAFGIERAFLTSIHAYTNQLRLADVPTEDLRRGRAAAENIIPQHTDAAKVITTLLPQLDGKLSALAMNVPIADGSAVDLVCWHGKPVSTTAINEVVRTAATSRWPGVLDYEEDPVVSSDILRSPYSGTFDAQATMTLGERLSKTLTWYDNGWGYSHRAVDLMERLVAVAETTA